MVIFISLKVYLGFLSPEKSNMSIRESSLSVIHEVAKPQKPFTKPD